MWHFIADPHFGHSNIIKYCKRPFLSEEEMNVCEMINHGTIPHTDFKVSKSSVDLMDATIIHNINAVVEKNDNLVILGDFTCNSDKKEIKDYRERIKCKNVYLILGNHDERKECSDFFTACYENYLFNINGQNIFTSHYPARSWNKANRGSWMLYGHVHNGFYNEDHGMLSKYDEKVYTEGFSSVLKRYGIENQKIVEDLLAVSSSTKGIDLTLDVGVDHVRKSVPFGTPWNMNDIRKYMQDKLTSWAARKAMYKMI
jgi:calcineurin-like phosphoesterase family protein